MKTSTVNYQKNTQSISSHQVTVVKVLLICGILSSLVYVLATIAGALRWQGYSSVSQTVSELMAIDAPSRSLVIPIFLSYGLLVIAFSIGVYKAAGQNRSLRILAGLSLAYGIICLFGPFAPMHQRGVEQTLTDRLHIIGAMIDVLLIFLMIAFGSRAFGRHFFFYSMATIVAMILFGLLGALDGPRIAADMPTPWAGVKERINIGVFLLWQVILAIAILRN